MTRTHKRAILSIAAFVLMACAYITINNDYNKCIDNGNSIAMCTGRS